MGLAGMVAGQLPAGGVHILATPAELASLFGSPEPRLPLDAAIEGRLAVEVGPQLRETCGRWLSAASRILAEGAASGLADRGSSGETAETDYVRLLSEALGDVRAADRRQGLENLFWLAHSREIAEELDRRARVAGAPQDLRYRIHPLLAGVLRRAEESARPSAGRPQRLLADFRRGEGENDALVRSIIDDQLTLTEADGRDFDAGGVLVPLNARFRIGAAAFEEIRRILREALVQTFGGGSIRVRRLLEEVCPHGLPSLGDPPAAWDRLALADPVREALLRDVDGAPAALARSRTLRREVPTDGTAGDLLDAYVDLTRCLRRAEAVRVLRRSLTVSNRGLDHAGTRERFLEGRLFRFGIGPAVRSGVCTATILFADIRGFTRASEGPVSEGDLARELCEIFDPAALIVRRFGGTVDTYLGDGFMATFSGGAGPAEGPLAAIRTAVVLQQVLGRLRRQGRTTFRMGISLHVGRVSVARFFRDERETQTTYIGRQVNVAGRLSSSAAADSGRPPADARRVGNVAVDAAGNLANQGIAVSGAVLDVLRPAVALESFSDSGVEGVRWYDPDLCFWLHLGYAGEARFRGIAATVPVYGLVAAAPAAAAGSEAP